MRKFFKVFNAVYGDCGIRERTPGSRTHFRQRVRGTNWITLITKLDELDDFLNVFPLVPVLHLVRDPVQIAIESHRGGLEDWDDCLQQWYDLNTAYLERTRQPWLPMTCERLWDEDGQDDRTAVHKVGKFFGLPYREELAEKWYGFRIGIPTAAGVIPPIVVPEHVRRLARTFGYEAKDWTEQEFKHIQEYRDGQNSPKYTGRIRGGIA